MSQISILVLPLNMGRMADELIQGAGYESTVFITKDRKEESIFGKNVYRVLFKGIHFKTEKICKS